MTSITIGSLLLGFALFGMVALFVTRPLVKSRRRRLSLPTRREALSAQKAAVLTQIKNLDFDYDTGKLPDDTYQQQRFELMAEATAILKELDQMESGEAGPQPAAGDVPRPVSDRSQAEVEIEAAVAALRRNRPKSSDSRSEEATPKRADNGRARFCPQCGESTDLGDKFCAHCGHALTNPQPA